MIKENILNIKQSLPESISIVAVTKGRQVEEIKKAIAAGITDIGENRVQEALIKYRQITSQRANEQRIAWHLVGHLQTNKAKDAVSIFDLIQSVEGLRLAEEIDRQAFRIKKVQDILIQVNTSGEKTKFGLKVDETIGVIKEALKFKNINIKGLMTIAPMVDNPEKTRPYFRLLRELRDKINNLQLTTYNLQLLSMGMTDDFRIAVEEGSNMVRLGRAIFG